MADTINPEVCPFIRNGFFALKRDGHVVEHGRMPSLSKRYRPGDIVLISADTAEGMSARLAQAAGEDGGCASPIGVRKSA